MCEGCRWLTVNKLTEVCRKTNLVLWRKENENFKCSSFLKKGLKKEDLRLIKGGKS